MTPAPANPNLIPGLLLLWSLAIYVLGMVTMAVIGTPGRRGKTDGPPAAEDQP